MWKKATCDLFFCGDEEGSEVWQDTQAAPRCCRRGAGCWDRTAEVTLVARRHSDESAKEPQPFSSSQSFLVGWKLLLRLPGFPRAPQTPVLPWLLGKCKNEKEEGEGWGCCRMRRKSRITLGERNRSLRVLRRKCCFMALQSWPGWGYYEFI